MDPFEVPAKADTAQSQATSSWLKDPLVFNIVSGSRLLFEGLAALLGCHFAHCTVTPFAGLPVPAWLPRPVFNMVLLDAGTGFEQSVQLIRAWRGAHPGVPILALEVAADADGIVAYIEAGASGYILRGAGVKTLLEALHMLRNGQAVCAPEIAARVFTRLAELRDNHPARDNAGVELTEREREVLACLCADCSNQEIAERLVIEVRTVKHHVHNILAKLRARHRWQAVMLAHERGLLRS